MQPEYFHDQNPTRTHGNTPPEYLVRAEEERDIAYQVIEFLSELDTDHNEAWSAMLERTKIEAQALEVKCGELYEQWQRSLPCTHPEDMVEAIMEGGITFENGSVDSDQREMLHCKACHKVW